MGGHIYMGRTVNGRDRRTICCRVARCVSAFLLIKYVASRKGWRTAGVARGARPQLVHPRVYVLEQEFVIAPQAGSRRIVQLVHLGEVCVQVGVVRRRVPGIPSFFLRPLLHLGHHPVEHRTALRARQPVQFLVRRRDPVLVGGRLEAASGRRNRPVRQERRQGESAHRGEDRAAPGSGTVLVFHVRKVRYGRQRG